MSDSATGPPDPRLADRLSHVRWIAGGTGAGKSTLARLLAERHDLAVYSGDVAERGWVPRFTPERHPRAWAWTRLSVEERARMPARRRVERMASLHGETIGFVVEDLLTYPRDRVVLADWFGSMPTDVAPLLTRPEQAVFLLPAPAFRRAALTARFLGDPGRARANWGDTDPRAALELRLARDELLDAEIRRRAVATGLPTLVVDGTRGVDDLADTLERRFRLSVRR